MLVWLTCLSLCAQVSKNVKHGLCPRHRTCSLVCALYMCCYWIVNPNCWCSFELCFHFPIYSCMFVASQMNKCIVSWVPFYYFWFIEQHKHFDSLIPFHLALVACVWWWNQHNRICSLLGGWHFFVFFISKIGQLADIVMTLWWKCNSIAVGHTTILIILMNALFRFFQSRANMLVYWQSHSWTNKPS